MLLSGSDQIWNPKIFPDGRFDPVFFGAFSHKRKIAYAPSFGIPRIPDGMEEELRTYLESFSHLSVRERQGQGIVRDITGKDVPVVLDPTLLLERTDWAAAARDGGAGRGYILCYCISRPDALAPYIRRLAEESRRTHMNFVWSVHPAMQNGVDLSSRETVDQGVEADRKSVV